MVNKALARGIPASKIIEALNHEAIIGMGLILTTPVNHSKYSLILKTQRQLEQQIKRLQK